MKTLGHILALLIATGRLLGGSSSFTSPVNGVTYYNAYVEPHLSIEKQQGWQLCWAASISTIFKHYGHAVSQLAIVERIKGVPVDQAGWPRDMAAALSSEWTDDDGNSFKSECQIFDVMSGISTFTNDDLVDDLESDHPLLYCNSHHAMVLVQVTYAAVPPSGQKMIVDGVVLDPAPGVAPERHLNPFSEAHPFFAARVRVNDQ